MTVREKWESGKDEAQTVVKHVTEMKEHLNKVAQMAKTNLVTVQQG